MITNPVLRTFLLLSILIILAGILLIIFIQFNRGYAINHQQTDFHAQQKNLINHVYQSQLQSNTTTSNPLSVKLKKTAIAIPTEPEEIDLQAQVTKDTRKNNETRASSDTSRRKNLSSPQTLPVQRNYYWNQTHEAQDYQMSFLRNNPWSPYYDPRY